LLLRAVESQVGVVDQLTQALTDRRHPRYVVHPLADLRRAKRKARGHTLFKKLTQAHTAQQQAIELADEITVLVDWLHDDILAVIGPDGDIGCFTVTYVYPDHGRKAVVFFMSLPMEAALNSQNTTINIVVPNNNTSIFAELVARSFFATHGEREDVRFTIMDNSSQDGTDALEAYARSVGIDFRQSGLVATETKVNSHGEVLRQFVMENPECEYYLLLDADICFVKPDTVDTLIGEINEHDDVWAGQARSRRVTIPLFGPTPQAVKQDVSEYGSQKLTNKKKHYLHCSMQPKPPTGPSGSWVEPPKINHNELDEEGRKQPLITLVGGAKPRCQPCCTLVRNTAMFRRVADRIGFSKAWIFENAIEGAGIYDIMALMTAVMTTHEQVYLVSSCGVMHFWKVSYGLHEPSMDVKRDQCRLLLEQYRRREIPSMEMTG
jgi:hypothetical protein